MSWQVATPMPGSRLHKVAERYGLLPTREINNPWTHNMLLPGIGPGEVRWAVRKGMLLKDFYLVKNGHLNLKHLWRARTNLRVLVGLDPRPKAERWHADRRRHAAAQSHRAGGGGGGVTQGAGGGCGGELGGGKGGGSGIVESPHTLALVWPQVPPSGQVPPQSCKLPQPSPITPQ